MPPFIVLRIRIKKQIFLPKVLVISKNLCTFAALSIKRNEKHNRVTHLDPDLEIEFDEAEKSIEFDRGLAAYFQTSADQKQRLLDIARAKESEANLYKQLYFQEQAKNIRLKEENMRLEARVAELEARPNIVTDQLVLEQNVTNQEIKQQVLGYMPYIPTRPKPRSKSKIIDLTNQLDLWANTTTSL